MKLKREKECIDTDQEREYNLLVEVEPSWDWAVNGF